MIPTNPKKERSAAAAAVIKVRFVNVCGSRIGSSTLRSNKTKRTQQTREIRSKPETRKEARGFLSAKEKPSIIEEEAIASRMAPM